MEYPIHEYQIVLKEILTKKRYKHSCYVANECERLALHYHLDEKQAYAAGLLHDIMKDQSPQKLQEMISRADFNLCEVERTCPALWHAIAGAVYVNERFGIDDEDFLNAIRYHTAARDHMSQVEMVVYLGDLVSADRSYPDVEKMRLLAYQNLQTAMLEALKFAINDLVKSEKQIPFCTINAYNYYLGKEMPNHV